MASIHHQTYVSRGVKANRKAAVASAPIITSSPIQQPGPDPKFYTIIDSDGFSANPKLTQAAKRIYPNTTSQAGIGVTEEFLSPDEPLFHGSLESTTSAEGNSTAGFRVHFLYNPSEIAVSYAFNASVAPPEDQPKIGLTSPSTLDGATMSLDLFFDRTFEIAQRNINYRYYGVRNDTLLLEQVAGLLISGRHPGDQNYAQGPIHPGQNVRATFDRYAKFYFYGYVTGLNINFTQFTKDMVPVRAYASIQLTQIMDNPIENTGTGIPNQNKQLDTNKQNSPVNPFAGATAGITSSVGG